MLCCAVPPGCIRSVAHAHACMHACLHRAAVRAALCLVQDAFVQLRENNWALNYRGKRWSVTYDL